MNYQKTYLDIMKLYNKYSFCFTNEKLPYCILKEKRIYIPTEDFMNQDARIVFDLLHEIGHLETNKNGMKRFEEEFYATQWAINKSKEFGITIKETDKQLFQKYIWKWMDYSRKRKCENIPNNEMFILKW